MNDCQWNHPYPTLEYLRLLLASGGDAISLQTVNWMNFAFLDNFLCCPLLKMLRAIYRICWGQALIQLHIKDLMAIEKSSSSCPFTSCRSWISAQHWFGEQHILCLVLSVMRCLILLQGVLPGDSRGRYFCFCFTTPLAPGTQVKTEGGALQNNNSFQFLGCVVFPAHKQSNSLRYAANFS